MPTTGDDVIHSMRVFLGVFLPASVNDHLQMALDAVAPVGSYGGTSRDHRSLRWVPEENRHITLAFYGEVPSGSVDDLAAQLESELAVRPTLPLHLRGAGVFTGRTLWAGVQEANGHDSSPRPHSSSSSPLMDLMRAAEDIGAAYSTRASQTNAHQRRRAHVTVARTRDKRGGENEIRQRAEALSIYSGPEFIADTAHLIHSELGAGKSRQPLYSSIAELPLTATINPAS